MAKRQPSELESACREQRPVEFRRRHAQEKACGYVLGVSSQWILMASLSDIRFNGFDCYRKQDILELRIPLRNVEFVESALGKTNQKVPATPAIDLTDVEELLFTANLAFPLVTIHRDVISPNACQIGRVHKIEAGVVLLQEIDTDAKWEEKATPYKLKDITRVGFDGDYERALYAVGADPPILGPKI